MMLDYPTRNGSNGSRAAGARHRLVDKRLVARRDLRRGMEYGDLPGRRRSCWVKFVGERLAKDGALPQQFAASRNPSDIYDLYAKFWQQAASDYRAEFSIIANTGWKAARTFLDAASNGHNAYEIN